MQMNGKHYRIARCERDGNFKAYLKIRHNRFVFVIADRDRSTLEKRLQEEDPQPRTCYTMNDPVARLTDSDKKTIANINAGRKLNGMRPLEIKVRQCLRCQQMFESHNNRICQDCRSSPRYRHSGSIQGREFL